MSKEQTQNTGDDVSYERPEVTEMKKYFAIIDDLFAGTGRMRECAETYLPKFPLEDKDVYKARLNSSKLHPALKETIKKIIGRFFPDPLTPNDDIPTNLLPLIDSVDSGDQDLTMYCARWAECAIKYGMAFTMVDMPYVEGAKTAADTKGSRPYFSLIKPASIIGWRMGKIKVDDEIKKGLTQLRVLEGEEVNDGAFGVKTVDIIKVYEIGKWTSYKQDKDNKWVKHRDGTMDLPFIPLVPYYTNRVKNMVAIPPLLELAYLNISHWQSQSDQDNILHIARVPILTRTGASKKPSLDSNGNVVEDKTPLGTSFIIELPSEATMGYVEHTGAAIEAGRQSLVDLENLMEQSGAQLLKADGAIKTATQAGEDNAKGRSSLGMWVVALEDAIKQTLSIADRWLSGKGEGGSVKVNANLKPELAPIERMNTAILMNKSSLLSSQTTFKTAQTVGIVDDSIKWEEEQVRINSDMPTDDFGLGDV